MLTVLVLLRKEANSPSLTGTYEICMPDGWQTNRYNYRVVRLWGEDPEPYLTAGVNLVPLAPLANVTVEALPGLVRRMAARINAEPPAEGRQTLDGDVSAHGVALLGRAGVTVAGRSAEHAGIDDVSGDLERRPRR